MKSVKSEKGENKSEKSRNESQIQEGLSGVGLQSKSTNIWNE